MRLVIRTNDYAFCVLCHPDNHATFGNLSSFVQATEVCTEVAENITVNAVTASCNKTYIISVAKFTCYDSLIV